MPVALLITKYVTAIGKREFDERQALSKIVTNRKPKADN